jgi:hypothetical protein
MGFWVAHADPTTGAIDLATATELHPGPSRFLYPEERTGSRIETADGAVVVQQFSTDQRLRSWVWENYPGWEVNYQALWRLLEPLRGRYRLLAGATTPYCYLKEDESGLFRTVSVAGTGLAATVTATSDWLRVRVLDVKRPRLREGSSLVTYAETTLEFVIADPAYNDL